MVDANIVGQGHVDIRQGVGVQTDRIERRGLMAALDTSQSLVWFDANGAIVDANRNAQQMFAYNEVEMLQQDYYILCGASQSHALSYRREWNSISEGKTKHTERSFVAKDGTEVWASVNYAAIKNENGSTRRVMAIFIDMGRFACKPSDRRWVR